MRTRLLLTAFTLTAACGSQASPTPPIPVATPVTPPFMPRPPHGAPLGMAYCEDGSLTAPRHGLLISLHGYRARGHRLIALPVNAEGLPSPTATPEDIISGWEASDTQPKGTPVARDGSVWLVEDNNGTVLRLGQDAWAASRVAGETTRNREVADARLDAT